MKKKLIFSFFTIILFATALVTSAQTTYQPVVQIPRLNPPTQTTDQYVNALYLLSITVAELLAVVKIIFGGVKWMFSDVVTSKQSAIEDIRGAIFGLLIVLATVLILETVNPNLTRLNFLENAQPLNITITNPQGETAPEPVAIGEERSFGPGQSSAMERFKQGCEGKIVTVTGGRGGVRLRCEAN